MIRLSNFISETGKGQDSGETQIEQGRESEHWKVADVASLVKQTIRKHTC